MGRVQRTAPAASILDSVVSSEHAARTLGRKFSSGKPNTQAGTPARTSARSALHPISVDNAATESGSSLREEDICVTLDERPTHRTLSMTWPRTLARLNLQAMM